jgi:hypothetical protein
VILAPYTEAKQHPKARDLLQAHAPEPVLWARIEAGDDTGYARLLADAWRTAGDLVVVEHDIGIRAGVVEELLACPMPWCGFSYPVGDLLLVALGCTKFSARLRTALPAAMDTAAADTDSGMQAGDWRRLDVRLAAALEHYGHVRHRHDPPVEHYHVY